MVTTYILNIKRLEQDKIFQSYFGDMRPERRKKIERAKSRMDKNRSLGAGIILARGLFAYGIDSRKAVIREGRYGKPYLVKDVGVDSAEEPLDVYFNLSHSGDYVVGAFGGTPVGIDIEHQRENIEKLARRCFNTKEQEQFLACGSREEREELFLRYWTGKESASKALGLGLQLDFRNISCETEGRVLVNTGDKCENYFLREIEILPKTDIMENGKDKYRIAVCAKTPDFAPKPVWVELDETV